MKRTCRFHFLQTFSTYILSISKWSFHVWLNSSDKNLVLSKVIHHIFSDFDGQKLIYKAKFVSNFSSTDLGTVFKQLYHLLEQAVLQMFEANVHVFQSILSRSNTISCFIIPCLIQFWEPLLCSPSPLRNHACQCLCESIEPKTIQTVWRATNIFFVVNFVFFFLVWPKTKLVLRNRSILLSIHIESTIKENSQVLFMLFFISTGSVGFRLKFLVQKIQPFILNLTFIISKE